MKRKKQIWTKISENLLMKKQICDLDLKIEGTMVQERVELLYKELEAKQILLRPKTYVGDEWYSPDGVVAIAIPFYLLHSKLIALEKKLMYEAEGESEDWFMRIIRHEAGHCIDHAFGLSQNRLWRKVFGSPKKEYDPDWYRPRLYSRNFVRNLQHGYAQSHPDEDFAETFAVWLNPSIDWKEQYKKWPGALRKLYYIDKEMAKLRNLEPKKQIKVRLNPFTRSKITLEKFYQRRIRARAEENPDFFDNDLRKLFSGDTKLPLREYSAAKYMAKNRKELVSIISRWSGEKKYLVHDLIRRLTVRLEEIKLRLGKDQKMRETEIEIASYLSSLVTHYRLTGRFKRDI